MTRRGAITWRPSEMPGPSFNVPMAATVPSENVDNLNGFAAHAIEDAVGCLDELTNAGPLVTVNHAAKEGKSRQLITALQNAVDRTVRGSL